MDSSQTTPSPDRSLSRPRTLWCAIAATGLALLILALVSKTEAQQGPGPGGPGGAGPGGPGGPGMRHGGNIIFQVLKPTKDVKEHVLFSHEAHLKTGLNCGDCHGKVFSKEKRMGINKFTMRDITAGKACGSCHNGKTKTQGEGTVFAPEGNCAKCHNMKLRKA
jgi:c(7)-type cytochrome triheme protein